MGSIVAAATLLATFVVDAPAGDDPAAAIRTDVDALVKMLDDRWAGRDDEGPSPSARVNRLVAAGDAKLRPVLAEAWKAATTWTAAARYKNPIRQLARFLYSLTETGKTAAQGDDEIVEEDGVVRIRQGDAVGGFGWKGWNGGGFGRKTDDSSPSFAELLKGGKLRKAPRPDVKKALASLDGGKIPETERFAVAKAIGEGCAANKTALQDLLRRQDADPADQWLMTALAWSGSAEAERPLRLEIETLAGRVADGKEAAIPILETACRALKRLRRDALVEEIGKLAGPPREAVLAAAGLDFATSIDLAAIEKTPDGPEKHAMLSAVCARIARGRGDARASSATLTALTKLLAANAASSDESLRAAVLDAAETLLYALNRYPIHTGASSNSGGSTVETKIDGESLGPYPDMATLLASLAADLAKGELSFADPVETSVFELTGGTERADDRALVSDAKNPDPLYASDGDRAPVKIRGETVGEGLRLTLTNVGTAPVAINPLALRYGIAEFTTHEGGGVKPYKQLKLRLGFVRAGVAVPADRLVVLAPKAEFSWTALVRPEHRGADHVSVEMLDSFAVLGKTPAPPLERFSETFVK
jgi:hypothetical protein